MSCCFSLAVYFRPEFVGDICRGGVFIRADLPGSFDDRVLQSARLVLYRINHAVTEQKAAQGLECKEMWACRVSASKTRSDSDIGYA